MSLTTRLLVFFQAALAVVLVAFCSAIYASARWYFHHRAIEAAERGVATLVASVDIEPDSVEWEPSDREVSLGPGPLGGEIYWYVTDARGNPVDRSPTSGTTDLVAATRNVATAGNVDGWAISQRRVHPPGVADEMLTRARTQEEVEKGEYPALVFTAGVRTEPLRTSLVALTAGLVGVAISLWCLALVVGRWVCRRALAPLTAMAEAARAMRAEDAESRLPHPGSPGELDELHAAIGGLLVRLHAALERERRFTAEASHQLRTPLGTILGQVDVALRRPRTQDEYERVLGVVRRQANDLARSVEALLFLARSDADAPLPPSEPVDLREWLSEFMANLQHPRRADVSVRTATDAALVIAAHPPLLKELFGNLVDNALKYSPAGTPVVLSASVQGESVTLAVEDRGAGIPPEDLPHVFDPFFRSGAAVGMPGSGLGLAVAARIAAAFGGRLTAENRPDGGSCFSVSLPDRGGKEDFIRASPAP